MADKQQKALRVTKSNDLIMASYRLTLNEQRLILAAICKLDPRRPMPKKVVVSAGDYASIYGVQLRHAYKQMKVAADELYERTIETFDGKGVDRKRWIDRAYYVEGEAKVEMNFTVHVMPYLSMLHSRVTTYDLRRVASLDSAHSFRLFEMLMQFKKTGWAYIEVESLRIALGLGDAYKRFNNLRQRVIDPAVVELKEKSGLDVSYTTKSEGRKVVAIKFEFTNIPQIPLDLSDDQDDQHDGCAQFEPVDEDDGAWVLTTKPLGEFVDASDEAP